MIIFCSLPLSVTADGSEIQTFSPLDSGTRDFRVPLFWVLTEENTYNKAGNEQSEKLCQKSRRQGVTGTFDFYRSEINRDRVKYRVGTAGKHRGASADKRLRAVFCKYVAQHGGGGASRNRTNQHKRNYFGRYSEKSEGGGE